MNDDTREELIEVGRRYLAAIVRHDPAGAPLHPALRATENGREIPVGEGCWRSIERFAGEQFFVDPQARQLVMMGVAYRDSRPWPFAVRLRIQGGHVIESEVVVSTDPKGHFADVEQLLKPDILYDAPVPPARAASLEQLRAAADSYWEGLERSDGSIPRFHYRCDKYDNGAKTTNTLRTLLSPDATVHTCASALDHTKAARPRARERRYPVLDVERGVAASFVVIDFHPIPDRPRPDAGSFYMMGVFKVVDCELRSVDEIREILPLGALSGW
ncbi:MAG: hypothetical protein JWL65_3855 [Gammaproteobacteria bacterium]|nr:hypothetical protein [Gammaproteobacteria bacterium]